MVGAISAAGLMGGLALVLAQLSRQQLVLQKRGQTQSEVEAISRRIGRMLYNPEACLMTVRASNFPTMASFTSVQTFSAPAIKNQKGGDVYEVNKTYGNGLVKVSSLKFKNLASIGGTVNIKTKLQVTLEKDLQGGHRLQKKPSAPTILVVARAPLTGTMSPPVRPISVPPSEKYARNSGEPTPPPIRVRPSPPASPVRRPPTPATPP